MLSYVISGALGTLVLCGIDGSVAWGQWGEGDRATLTFDEVSLQECANRALRRQSLVASQEALQLTGTVARAVNLNILRDKLDGQFNPRLQSGVTFNRALEGTPLIVADPRGRYSVTGINGNVGLGGALPLGGNYDVGVTTGAKWTSLNSSTLSPLYQNRLAATINQPLTNGAGWDIVRTERNVAEAEAKQLHQEHLRWGTDVLTQVVRAYWRLWAEERKLAVAKRLEEETATLARAIEDRYRRGRLIAARHLQGQRFKAQVKQVTYTIQQQLFRAERDLLLTTYVPPEKGAEPDAEHLAHALRTTDNPPLERDTRTLADLIEVAVEQRPYIKEIKYLIDAARLRLNAAESAALPKLNLVMSAGLAAMAGESTYGLPGHELVVKPPPDVHVGGYGDVWGENLWSEGLPFFEVGLKFELPLHENTRTFEERTAFFNLKRWEIGINVLKQDVAIQVRDALFQQRAAYDKLIAAQDLAKAVLLEYQQHLRDFRDGMDNSEQMLRVMLIWIDAKAAESETRADYAIAYSDLRAAIGDLIEYLGAEPLHLENIPPIDTLIRTLANPDEN